MVRTLTYLLAIYFAFTWQASLRTVLEWNDFSPNFLVLALIGSCILLSDVSALIAAAILGLLSDSLARQGLGNDVLCFVVFGIALQALCPPKLVRNPLVLLAIIMSTTTGLELACTLLRSGLNHELTNVLTIASNDAKQSSLIFHWIRIAVGNGIYTGLLAVLPLVIIQTYRRTGFQESQETFANRWHRLTSS